MHVLELIGILREVAPLDEALVFESPQAVVGLAKAHPQGVGYLALGSGGVLRQQT